MAKTFLSAIEILVVILFFIECTSSQPEEHRLDKDIDQLASALPGCYNNARQYYMYSTARSAPYQKRKNIFLLRVEFYKMQSALFNDSLTIYFQDFTKSSKVPFSSGFYSFTPEYLTGTIRMRMHTFMEAVPGLRVSNSNYSIPPGSGDEQQLTAAIRRSRLKTYSSCDMVWKKISLRTFTGVTKSECLANLDQESVRISVSMTLAGSRITLTEGWYNLGDRARLRELKIPYILKRNSLQHQHHHQQQPRPMEHTPHNSILHTNARTSPQSQDLVEQAPIILSSKTPRNLKAYHSIPSLKTRSNRNRIRGSLRAYYERNSLKKKLYSRVNAQTQTNSDSSRATKPATITHNHKKVHHRRRQKRKILRKYSHVKTSLVTGQRVFYRIDLSKCKMAAQVPINRLIFGGEIKKFQIIREQRNAKRRTKMRFSTTSTSIGVKGVETMRREITLHRGGQVEVKVTKQTHDTRRMKRQYTFQCRLFSKKKRRGGLKLFADKSSHPKETTSLTRMTRSLENGRGLWLVSDVSKCRGRMAETTIMAGELISDYDVVNDGKTLQMFLPVDHANNGSPRKSPKSGFVVNIFKNNDVVLTWVNASNENARVKRKYEFRPAYHCELSNQISSTSNESKSESVRVFIR